MSIPPSTPPSRPTSGDSLRLRSDTSPASALHGLMSDDDLSGKELKLPPARTAQTSQSHSQPPRPTPAPQQWSPFTRHDSSPGHGISGAQRLPPLWRELSDQPFDEDDPESGPSDYWRRPSPDLISPTQIPSESPWLRSEPPPQSDNTLATPEEHHDADAAEYSKRLEQVLARNDSEPQTPVRPRRDSGGMHGTTDSETGWSDYHAQGQGYDSAVRSVLRDSDDSTKGEEEFGGRAPKDVDSHSTPSVTPAASVDRTPVRASPASRSYIHPSVSRLRSHQHSRVGSGATNMSSSPQQPRVASHFSQLSLSRSNSFSTSASLAGPSRPLAPHREESELGDDALQGPAFSFHPLRSLSTHLFNRNRDGSATPTPPIVPPAPSRRGSSLLGLSRSSTQSQDAADSGLGRPTVLDINGMVAAGTDRGWVVVYNFSQELRCVLGNDLIASNSGPVTAVTICPDQTFIGVGHANGNVYLYDLAHPMKPARTQLALTLKQVMSGRKEGHLQGSRILHIGFVGKRHTSIVTGDEDGRAFWFSLGRVMGVDSNDAVRMLGSYPEMDGEPPMSPGAEGPSVPSSIRSQTKRNTTLFAALPLPLGTGSHPTDEFHLSALLTPVKLVVVGMKPSAKTWHRKMRGITGGPFGGYTGCATWLKAGEVTPGDATHQPSDPVLAYSWGKSLRFLRVRVAVTKEPDLKKPETKTREIKTPEFVEGRRWEAPHAILSLHWFDPDHMLIITHHDLLLLNVRLMQLVERTPLQTRLLTSHDFFSGLSLRRSTIDTVPNSIASSARTYRSKLFLLTKANVQVGTLQYWNDRVLANVHRGDFLAAINLALAYYEGRAPGNTIGLPEYPLERHEVVGARIRELMRASLEWAFSEDRMKDDTHFSADGRGVDLTSLFEGLATACIDACIAMDDTDFLFDSAFEHYSNAGIQGIFLSKLETYIFEGRIQEVPPGVTQALISMHEDRSEFAEAESVIWHIEPQCLDINQAVTLCEKRGLWDALIYVYTRAMGDYVAPLVKLIRVLCDVQRYRRDRPSLVGEDAADENDEERFAPDAYKLYGYVTHVLSGLWYPSGEAMREPEATRARSEAYTMIFSDHIVDWPIGSGELVLTDADEPTYPYLRLLLRFDTEAFLHAMDIAFEDSYLNDPTHAINRQSIINLMLDVMESFHSSDVTLLHIFVARNLPKYPQFIFIPPDTSHRILVSLAADPDQSTREDRQLAAEYLLSAYTPHDGDEMLARFEEAGFFRILRAAYRRDKKWGSLIETLLKDPETDDSVFGSLEQIVAEAKTPNGASEVAHAVEQALPALFDLSVRQTAHFLDRCLPQLHDAAIAGLEEAQHKQAAYLRCLLDPTADEDSDSAVVDDSAPAPTETAVSTHLGLLARHKYVTLLAQHDASSVVPFLDARGKDFFDLTDLAEQAEDAGLPEAQLWALDRAGRRKEVFDTVSSVLTRHGADLAMGLSGLDEGEVHIALGTLRGVTAMAIRLCTEHSAEGAVEDMWFGVLHSITNLLHNVTALNEAVREAPLGAESLDTLRTLVQDTLQALLSSNADISFARLFKRLVEASSSDDEADSEGNHPSHAPVYAEFRAILTGMLDSFRNNAEALELTTRLIQADGFDLLAEQVRRARQGWSAKHQCAICKQDLFGGKTEGEIKVTQDGSVHVACEMAVLADDELSPGIDEAPTSLLPGETAAGEPKGKSKLVVA